jgi:ferredoxin
MRVIVDETTCEHHGQCTIAMDACPTQSIRIEG